MAQTYSITQLKSDLTAIGHGTTLNKVQNFDGLLLRACRQVLSDIDLKETVRKTSFTLYKDVYDYVCPSDIKENKIIDIHPINNDYNASVFSQRFNQTFNRNVVKGGVNNDINYDYDQYLRAIKINAKLLPVPIIIDNATTATGYTGTVTNLITDTVNYRLNKASVRFNASSGQYVQKTLAKPVDLTSHLNLSALFFDVYVSASITSLEFRLQTNNLNYYKWTITTNSLGNALTEGWHKIKMDWVNATIVGSPVASTINVFIMYVTTASPVIVNVDNFTSNLGKVYRMSYYSENMFRNNVTGAFESSPSSDSSFFNASNEGYNLILNQVAMYAVQQVQGGSQNTDATFFANEYQRVLTKQKQEYKSQIQKPQEFYYKVWRGGNNYPTN